MNKAIAPQAKTQEAATLPAYIIERNNQARRAGLDVEKQMVTGCRLTTWYTGTESQWRKSGFIRPGRFTFPKRGQSGHYLSTFCPSDTWGTVTFCLRAVSEGSSFRGAIGKEWLPEWTEVLGGRVTAYEFREDSRHQLVYIGSLRELVGRKLAPSEIGGQGWARAQGAVSEVIWDDREMSDGRHIFRKHLDAIERVAQAEEARNKVPFRTPRAFLEFIGGVACNVVKVQVKAHRSVRTTDDKIYAITKDSQDAIEEAISDLYSAITQASVRVTSAIKSSPEAEGALLRAKKDPAFRDFLGGLLTSE